ncbi:MAG: roadblock/LC7 domain-containing protein [Marinobacter sp.]|nr:roadblock/LC7 domain-containing protein [Marinobacter sp.]
MNSVVDSGQFHPKASAARSILRELNASSSEIEASATMTTDGYIIGAVLGTQTDEDRFAAMCASLLALAERAADEIGRGQMKQLLVEGTQGLMLLVRAGDDKVLALAAKPTVNLGRVFIEARRCAAKIDQVIGAG